MGRHVISFGVKGLPKGCGYMDQIIIIEKSSEVVNVKKKNSRNETKTNPERFQTKLRLFRV